MQKIVVSQSAAAPLRLVLAVAFGLTANIAWAQAAPDTTSILNTASEILAAVDGALLTQAQSMAGNITAWALKILGLSLVFMILWKAVEWLLSDHGGFNSMVAELIHMGIIATIITSFIIPLPGLSTSGYAATVGMIDSTVSSIGSSLTGGTSPKDIVGQTATVASSLLSKAGIAFQAKLAGNSTGWTLLTLGFNTVLDYAIMAIGLIVLLLVLVLMVVAVLSAFLYSVVVFAIGAALGPFFIAFMLLPVTKDMGISWFMFMTKTAMIKVVIAVLFAFIGPLVAVLDKIGGFTPDANFWSFAIYLSGLCLFAAVIAWMAGQVIPITNTLFGGALSMVQSALANGATGAANGTMAGGAKGAAAGLLGGAAAATGVAGRIATAGASAVGKAVGATPTGQAAMANIGRAANSPLGRAVTSGARTAASVAGAAAAGAASGAGVKRVAAGFEKGNAGKAASAISTGFAAGYNGGTKAPASPETAGKGDGAVKTAAAPSDPDVAGGYVGALQQQTQAGRDAAKARPDQSPMQDSPPSARSQSSIDRVQQSMSQQDAAVTAANASAAREGRPPLSAAAETSARQGFVQGEIYNAARNEAGSAAARRYQETNARAGRETPPNELGAVRATAAAKYDAANRGAIGATAAAAQRVRDGSGNLSVADQTAARAGIAGNRAAVRAAKANSQPSGEKTSQPASAERLNTLHKNVMANAQRQTATSSKSLPQRLNEFKALKASANGSNVPDARRKAQSQATQIAGANTNSASPGAAAQARSVTTEAVPSNVAAPAAPSATRVPSSTPLSPALPSSPASPSAPSAPAAPAGSVPSTPPAPSPIKEVVPSLAPTPTMVTPPIPKAGSEV